MTRGTGLRVVFAPALPVSLVGGGMEHQLLETARALADLDCDVRLLNHADEGQLEWADIVHVWHVSQSNLLSNLTARIPTVCSPVFFQTGRLPQLAFKSMRSAPGTVSRSIASSLKAAHQILPNSRAEADQLVRLFDVSPSKISVVPNAASLRTEMSEEVALKLVQRVLPGLEETKFVFSAHRIEDRKNSIRLVRAAVRTGLPLVIAGRLGEGRQSGFCEQFLKEVDSASQVFYVGPLGRPELEAFYTVAHAHALVSHMETPGLASLEAGLADCNLVVGRCAPVREYFDSVAVVVDQGVRAIADGLAVAMEMPRGSLRARERIERQFSWGEAAKRTREAYDRAIQNFQYSA